MRGVWCRCWGWGLAAVAAFLGAGTLQAAGRSEAPFEVLKRHGLESEAAFKQLFQGLDGLLKVGGVAEGVRGLDLHRAAFARIGGAAFVQAELARPEPCIQELAGCEAIVGAFLTSTDLQDPGTHLAFPVGVYGVRRRTAPSGDAVLEFLTPAGGVAHARAVERSGDGLATHGLSVSYGEGLQVCGEWSTSAVCWTATVNETAADTVRGVGVVFFDPIEGGCWGILVLGGAHFPRGGYETPGLPEEFKVNGLQVRFTGRVLKYVATVCMTAPVLELITVEAVGARSWNFCSYCED